MRALLALPLVLAACATPQAMPGPAPIAIPAAATADRVAAECRLLERAQAETEARGLRAWPDVLVGCPGHEGLGNAMTLSQASGATRAANAARPPAAVRAMGARAETLFRRMITRGVPVAVAEAVAGTPEFAAAAR
jgi:hypothetical protein